MEFEEPRADGGAWLTLKFPLFDVDGDIYAVGGISTDISLRRREELLARRAKDEAERANEAKSQFLSRMSHELRTPLNSILGFGQLLQLQVPPGPRRESVDRIVMAGRHLLALINEVLEISRIEAHGARHEVEPVDVCRPLTDAVELLRPLAEERRHRHPPGPARRPVPLRARRPPAPDAGAAQRPVQRDQVQPRRRQRADLVPRRPRRPAAAVHRRHGMRHPAGVAGEGVHAVRAGRGRPHRDGGDRGSG